MGPVRINETAITSENVFNGNYFGVECNHESGNDKKNFVLGISDDL